MEQGGGEPKLGGWKCRKRVTQESGSDFGDGEERSRNREKKLKVMIQWKELEECQARRRSED